MAITVPLRKLIRENYEEKGRHARVARLVFAPETETIVPTRHLSDGRGLAYACELDEGPAGTIHLPDGARLVADPDVSGDLLLLLPGDTIYMTADDACDLARGNGYRGMRLI